MPGYPWTDEPVGGIFHQTQARALARLGLDVAVIAATPWAPWPLPVLRARWQHYANAPRAAMDGDVMVVRPRYPNVPRQPSWAQADRMIARAAWRARHEWSGARVSHGHAVVEGLAAWRLARVAQLPLILTFHGSTSTRGPIATRSSGDLRAAAREARAVIAVSGALAERIHELTGVTAIHLPIGGNHHELIDAARPRDAARRALGLPGDRVIVLFVGHLLRAKGVRELADAIVALDDRFVGVFVGGGPELGYGTDRAKPQRLVYTGELPHDDVIQYMSAADVLVLPSYSEGLPTSSRSGALGLRDRSAVVGIPELLGVDRGPILGEVSPGRSRCPAVPWPIGFAR